MFGLGKGGNGKGFKRTELQVDAADLILVASDLACFTMACIIGGDNNLANITANNILVREVQKYGEWKKLKAVLDPRAAELYLRDRKIRLFEELKQLAAVQFKPVELKEESPDGSGSGNQSPAEQGTGVRNGDSETHGA